ncbi:hypothetical protein GTP46_11485 [Duganella sp. FT135W]|uniref:Uncharacterized protein n=1 Tax=Duganella flavida TaxID=2692175 RepID=A0A6L8KAI0_9BURK|nr:hypothetical protein [Duganella flavida]MYM23268.1 hypothetical protein [Duganella flavida]
MNQIKLNPSRKTSGALLVNVLVNDKLVFATASGQQLACAVHEIGIKSFVQLSDEILGAKSNQDNPRQTIEDQIFWHDVLVGFVDLQSRPDTKNSAEYQFVASILPSYLVSSELRATPSCSETAQTYFRQFVTYPPLNTH